MTAARIGRVPSSDVNLDRRTLDLAAPVLCTLASLVSLLAAMRKGNRTAGAVLSGVFGVVGSAAWALAALDDRAQSDAEVTPTAPTTA